MYILTLTNSSEDNFLIVWQPYNTLRQFPIIFKGEVAIMEIRTLMRFV